MPHVHIVLDSTSHVAPSMLQSHDNLHVVPLQVILGVRQWAEGQLSNGELLKMISETGIYPKTSQPSLGDFVQVFQPLIDTGNDIVVITVSGGLSGTVGGAKAAAEAVSRERIHVIDSGTTAIGMVKLAEVALDMANQGVSAGEIASRIKALSAATHTLFVPGTLEYLHKGGRIGGAAALLGTVLKIHPVLHLTNGKVAVLDKVRTWSKAVNRIVEELKQHNNPVYIGVVHLEAPEEARKLEAQVAELYPGMPISVTTGGPVLFSHLGPGLVGVIFQDAV